MSLTDKLRELSSLDKSVDVPSLIREAERLEAQNYGLTKESVELAEEVKALRSQVTELEAQNARLRELVPEAWDEGFEVGDVGNPRRSGWAMSKVKAALDALDKEGDRGSVSNLP